MPYDMSASGVIKSEGFVFTMTPRFRIANASADTDIRRALAEYHTARCQRREIALDEPHTDEPAHIHEGFDRLYKAAAKAEQMARDDLQNAVTAFAGPAPCAVIVDSVGGSSVVALSGKPNGMLVAAAADRVHIKDVFCRPEPPPEFAHEYRQMAPNQAGVYIVMQRGDLVAIYNGVYFRSTNEVIADFQELIQAGFEGMWSDDYVIWCDGRIMAVIHGPLDGREQKLILFNEPRNDPIAGRAITPMRNWPTYEEWIESGRGDLWHAGSRD
jgi:hypothetical protein